MSWRQGAQRRGTVWWSTVVAVVALMLLPALALAQEPTDLEALGPPPALQEALEGEATTPAEGEGAAPPEGEGAAPPPEEDPGSTSGDATAPPPAEEPAAGAPPPAEEPPPPAEEPATPVPAPPPVVKDVVPVLPPAPDALSQAPRPPIVLPPPESGPPEPPMAVATRPAPAPQVVPDAPQAAAATSADRPDEAAGAPAAGEVPPTTAPAHVEPMSRHIGAGLASLTPPERAARRAIGAAGLPSTPAGNPFVRVNAPAGAAGPSGASLLAVLAGYVMPGGTLPASSTLFILLQLAVLAAGFALPRLGRGEPLVERARLGPRAGHLRAVQRPG